MKNTGKISFVTAKLIVEISFEKVMNHKSDDAYAKEDRKNLNRVSLKS